MIVRDNYQALVTGVASLALSILNGKNTAKMHPLQVEIENSIISCQVVI